jgi:hypothetical protein
LCRWGTTENIRVKLIAPLSHTGRARWAVKPIDKCIAPLVRALQREGIETTSSCCGHGKGPGEILFADGRRLMIISREG